MYKFFEKYSHTPDESDAIKMIHDKIEKAYEKYNNEKGDKYMRELSEAYEMLCDFFKVKNVDVDSFSETD